MYCDAASPYPVPGFTDTYRMPAGRSTRRVYDRLAGRLAEIVGLTSADVRSERGAHVADRRDDWIRIESRALGELAALHSSPVFWGRDVKRGDGRLVIVVPGLFGNDVYLGPLRDWLRRMGYQPAGRR